MRRTLIKAIKHRKYILMTTETMQSLQNSYIDLLEKIKDDSEDDALKELGEILLLFKDRGAATIDEIDTSFIPFRELNFPNNNKFKLDSQHIETVIEIFKITITNFPRINKS